MTTTMSITPTHSPSSLPVCRIYLMIGCQDLSATITGQLAFGCIMYGVGGWWPMDGDLLIQTKAGTGHWAGCDHMLHSYYEVPVAQY